MYYRLKEPYRLCGHGDQLLTLDPGDPGQALRLSPPLFRLLSRCDGLEPLTPEALSETERTVLLRCQEQGIVSRSAAPDPILDVQRYTYYANRRVPNLELSITGRCNLRCRHCFNADDKGLLQESFSIEQVRDLAAQMRGCGVRNVMLTGGEPLVHPDFYGITEAIAAAGLRISRLYTNGVLLDERVLSHFRSLGGKPEIVISFDGLGKHDWMRGVDGTEEAALRAIRLVCGEGFPLCVAMNLNAATLPVAVETARHLFSLGVRHLFFIRTTETPKWLASGGESLAPAQYCRAVVELGKELHPEYLRGLKIRFYNCYNMSPGMKMPGGDLIEDVDLSSWASEPAWCEKAVNTAFLGVDGRVLPCDGCDGASRYYNILSSDNNVFSRPLQDILVDSVYARFMRCTVGNVLAANPDCRACKYVARCRGGICRACAILHVAVQTGRQTDMSTDESSLCGTPPVTCAFYKGGYYDEIVGLLQEEKPASDKS